MEMIKYVALKINKLKNYFIDWLYLFLRYFNTRKTSLKKAYSGKFLIGTAFNKSLRHKSQRKPYHLLHKHFNVVTIVGCLKPYVTHPSQDVFDFNEADGMVDWAEKHNMPIVGHYLVSSLFFPQWIYSDKDGNDVSREELIDRLRIYITTVVGRYKGRIHTWEAVHEVFNNDGIYLNSKFHSIIGEDFVRLSFDFARQADPDCELCYSDAILSMEAKRNAVVEMVKKLQAQGTKIDTIGMQGHCHLGFPKIEEMEKSIIAFHELGCKISITEMDLSVLPVYNPRVLNTATALSPDYWQSLNPFSEGLPDKIAKMQAQKYKDLFALFIKHADKIDRVTLWGITDDTSAKNDFPVIGRTDYPLLFDRNYKAKPVVKDLIEMALKA
ncbi:MAG: endo-1,4-beta-xylanase [Paludibacter sp.]|jgi:endo-1,4-beta-xylanase|nr:endo-1,4-beta-xylanase [Paludibacter sp.]